MAHFTPEDIIYETEHFLLTRAARPFVSREEGGHLRMFCKRPEVAERRDFTPQEAVEFIWLSSIAGEALERAMNKRGVNIVKINFQEMGNWPFKTGDKVTFHEHIFGRAADATKQEFPEALHLPDRASGFYEGFEPLTDEDVAAIHAEAEALAASNKYADKTAWRL
jgi:diadenosine tetraphosphate (Ap4A) HIT family hydrolase